MQEKNIKEQLDKIKGLNPKTSMLNSVFKHKGFSWLVLSIAVLLMFIDNFLKMDALVGGWHIVVYILLLVPLGFLAWKNKLENPYIKWFFPVLLIMIWDMFYYSNEFVQYFLPIVFYVLVITLYLTSTHKLHAFYQTLLPRFLLDGIGISYIKEFFSNLFMEDENRQLYTRIGLALLITLPVLGVFVALLSTADENFSKFLRNMFDFDFSFEFKYLITVPLTLFLYLLLFTFGLSNHKERLTIKEHKEMDMLIVGIFLGLINLLFLMFVAIQLPFLFGMSYLPEHTTLAAFAREGFFQLMMVMGIVLLIFLVIMRRYKGEKITMLLLSGFLLQTIIMGIVSLKKMYLYQSIKGATVMRYYVEWFDYFLLTILAVGLFFLVRQIRFSKLLDVGAVLSVVAFTVIVSLNIDAMVATHNIEKFKDNPEALDTVALSNLSIDALPAISKANIMLGDKTIRTRYEDEAVTLYWYQERKRDNCHSFSTYHYGYCSQLKAYGK